MTVKEPILEFAKELYLTPNEQGNHKYSLQNICDKILQKFNKSLTRPTILNWSRKYGWDKLWDESFKRGITKDFKSDEDKALDEKYQEAIAKAKREDFLMATNLKIWAYNFIKNEGFSNTSEALKAIEAGMRYTNDLVITLNEKGEMIYKIEVIDKEAKELTDRILDGEKT